MPTPLQRSLYLSDRAYEKLTQDGYSLGYLRSQIVARGIEHYFKALAAPHVSYSDQRPEHIQDTDQWCTGVDLQRKRLVVMTEETCLRYAILALTYGIPRFAAQRVILNGIQARVTNESAFSNAWPLVSSVLEAIGIGWLRPSGVDQAPADLWRMDARAWRKQMKYRRSQRGHWSGY